MPTMGTNPLDFIRHNLFMLHPSLDNPHRAWLRDDGTVIVRLIDVTDSFGNVIRSRNRKGLASMVPRACQRWWTKAAKIYSVMPAKEGDVFPAYICPYADNETHTKMLGGDADVMFTGDMDGCTFGVGIPNRDGGVLVGHANAQKDAELDLDDPTAAQRQSQKDSLAKKGIGRLVDPDDYRLPEVVVPNPNKRGKWLRREFKAITIGLRINANWEFYYQHQLVDGYDWREKVELVKLQ
jgi:hypothetical protein